MTGQARKLEEAIQDGLPPEEIGKLKDWFLQQVSEFGIYSTILGVIMFIATYFSIMLFNYAAHSQVRIYSFIDLNCENSFYFQNIDLYNSRKIFKISFKPRYCLV